MLTGNLSTSTTSKQQAVQTTISSTNHFENMTTVSNYGIFKEGMCLKVYKNQENSLLWNFSDKFL